MRIEISRFVNLDGLQKRDVTNVKRNNHYVVKHDEIQICGKSIIESIINKNKSL